MYEIDNQKFGGFVAALRKEKGYTQKELAEKLFLSDKAISKWERGLSLPDIALLEPLADILGVTVAELLKGERIHAALEPQEMDELLGKTIHLSDNQKHVHSGFHKMWYLFVLGFSILEFGILIWQDVNLIQKDIFVLEALFALFGAWFCLFAKEQLPTYYDENELHYVSDGVFRMNIPFIRIHNSNWPYIAKMLPILDAGIHDPISCCQLSPGYGRLVGIVSKSGYFDLGIRVVWYHSWNWKIL
ncbi:MAG: helix-turn-helix domain-containing protein [Mediterraneibacter gnavus]